MLAFIYCKQGCFETQINYATTCSVKKSGVVAGSLATSDSDHLLDFASDKRF